ncbi:hypothetical protein DE146DRAFT_281682 [Phaeosphaeria sp. MPI-PUGE-AT-0046c]|nr:hypothetical protein DE146DRAFT_281682 [Phaeosphaeria sp. MPI-PUGE-AT-0046c]
MPMEHGTDHAYERRREQVRRAQKSHRTRKAIYFKSLEDEVLELRRQNAALLKGSKASRDIIQQYQHILAANNLPFPPSDPEVPTSDELTTINVIGDNYQTQGLQAQFAPAYPPSESSSATQQSHTPSLQNITQIGINFILALEQPCLSHRNHTPPELLITDSTAATGHEAMLSSPITARGPKSTPISSVDEEYPPDAQWTVPTAELEGLLRSSQGLGLGTEEVTPVQAWQIITQHNRFDGLMFDLLERLKLTLLPMVECYGFGAVIERVGFEKALDDIFS